MDAGGIAQMTYNNLPSNNLGPTSSFASRGKGAHIKRLSVAPPSNMGSINENEVDNNPAPRTSRAHMLSGLRTAPKINTNMGPASAPHSQTRFSNDTHSARTPQTGYGNMRGGFGQSNFNGQSNQHTFTPEQVLAPSLNIVADDASQMDPQMYSNLMMTNTYLAQRQQQLQQQLMSVQAAAQQFQGMNLNGQQYGASPLSPGSSIYNQQLQNGMQPIVQIVPNHPGMYSVYNPMTGQQSFYPESALQQPQQNVPQSPAEAAFRPENGFNRADSKSPPSAANGNSWARSFTPPRQTPSPPQDVAPLPEPSAGAYRPGHRRSISSMNKAGDVKGNAIRPAGVPQTPVDGTFGLGLGRAGEHPTRQPRGPPPLEELAAAPTSKQDGSKNFATRQRRRALFSLVRAGNERRVGRPGSANDDVSTPGSDSGTPFGHSSSDGESDMTPATGSLSAHSSFGSLKAAAGGAIGSEVKHLKERSHSRDTFARRLTTESNSSNEDASNGAGGERRRTPMLVLTSAEKRKSSMSSATAFA